MFTFAFPLGVVSVTKGPLIGLFLAAPRRSILAYANTVARKSVVIGPNPPFIGLGEKVRKQPYAILRRSPCVHPFLTPSPT